MRDRDLVLTRLETILGQVECGHHTSILIGLHRDGRVSDGQVNRPMTAFNNLAPPTRGSPFFTVAHIFPCGPIGPFVFETMETQEPS